MMIEIETVAFIHRYQCNVGVCVCFLLFVCKNNVRQKSESDKKKLNTKINNNIFACLHITNTWMRTRNGKIFNRFCD